MGTSVFPSDCGNVYLLGSLKGQDELQPWELSEGELEEGTVFICVSCCLEVT